MKYFFLSEGWRVGRVWELGGLWNEASWRRSPDIRRMNLSISENDERLWLYRVEEAVLMVEVKPSTDTGATSTNQTIGQVVLKRLMSADQTLELLCQDEVGSLDRGSRSE